MCIFTVALCSLILIKSLNCTQLLDETASGDLESINGELEFSSSSSSNYDLSENFVVNPEDERDKTKFSWRHHQEDHGVYSQRSLMSTENIKLNNDNNNNKDTEYDEILRKTLILSNKQEVSFNEDDPLKTSDYAEKEWQLMFRAYDMAMDGVSSSFLQTIGQKTNLFEEIISRLKPECRRDIYHTRDSFKKHKLWALRMVDSNGKIPSGMSYGRFASPGDYEECLSVLVDEHIYSALDDSTGGNGGGPAPEKTTNTDSKLKHYKFHGKYCLIDYRLPMPERPPEKLLSIHDPVIDLSKTEMAKHFPELANYSGFASIFYEVGFMHGLCLPSSCDVKDLTKSIGLALEGLHIIVNNTIDCEERFDEPKPLRTSQIISITFLTILFINAIGASIAHHYQSKDMKKKARAQLHPTPVEKLKLGESFKHHNKEEEVGGRGAGSTGSLNPVAKFLNRVKKSKFYSDCFSIQKNFERLSKPDPRGLTFVHYTRIVAMALTVITHTAAMGTLQAITKPADASNSEQIFRDFMPQMLANSFTSIQIFFFMAGFMLVISTYPSIRRDKGHISFLEYAVKRAIRLLPGIAATICINFIWPLLFDGPMLTYFVRAIVIPCETNWWRTMSFLSNFDHVEKMCLRHSYFSASDYQLHFMAFPLLILLYKQPAVSLTMAGVLVVGGFVAQVIIVLTKTVMPFIMVDYMDKEAFFNVVHYIHHPVWNHMSAFFYGFIMGYMVVKQIRIDISDKTIKKVWMVLLPLGICSIFAPYFWNHYKRPIYKWQMVVYVVIDRFILLTTCAWLSYASMVLSKPKPTPQSISSIPGKQINLPRIVTLETPQDNKDKQLEPATGGSMASPPPQIITTEVDQQQQAAQQSLTTGLSVASLSRHRSSPNIRAMHKQAEEQTTLRPAVSSVNVGTEQVSSESPEVEDQTKATGDREAQQSQSASRRPQLPISNVNTLCLILSRLTFQLYLFNMVILWIDVNHSKYLWFFSYYFIITKALAVYICSSIMATIFFITMESPALTIYISWVKSRAQARAHRTVKRDDLVRRQDLDKNGNKQGANINQANRFAVSQSPDFNRQQPVASSRQSPDGSFDGLYMREGPDSKGLAARPTFSYIDLSEKEQTGESKTKM